MRKLFEITKMNQMELKNRFIRSATMEGLVNSDGSGSEEMTDLMVDLAKGQVGLIITGHAYVNPTGQAGIGQLAIYDDRFIDGYKKMVEKVHEEGSKVILQINHAGVKAFTKFTKSKPLGPSHIEIDDCEGREMSISEISQTIDDFKNAAVRAKKAGFDGVQIHAAHGYLLSEFLSPVFNKRTDEYGGSIKNRARLILQILQAIKSTSGKEFIVIIKINSDDFTAGGFTQSEMLQVALMLESAGIDAIEFSGSINVSTSKYPTAREGQVDSKEEVYYRDAAKSYKEKITVPLILLGGIRSYEVVKELIEKEQADYVSLSRPFIREPNLIKRWQSGDTKKATCISCNKCLELIKVGKAIYCIYEKQKS